MPFLTKSFIKLDGFFILMADDKIRMPSSGAGLTTFHEESSSRVRISPQTVLALTILTIIVVIILNTTMTP